MPFRAWRWAAATLLVVIAADIAATPDVVAATGTSQTRIQTTAGTHSAATKSTATRRRRARRGPQGGVVYARCAVVIDPLTGQVLFGKNPDTSAPIASITKLMTAMVFLEQKPDLSRSVEVTREELYGGGHTQLRNKEMVTLGDLLHMSLMCSDNVATRVLAREAGLSRWEFLAHMNQKADELGLTGTDFVEITGLDERNVSTAADVAKLLRAASGNDLIHSITTTSVYDFRSDRRPHRVVNTNRLLHSRYQVLGGKTGFISEAGYCVATWIRAEGHDLIAVVLGAPTNATRFADVVRLVQKTIAQGFAPSES